MKSIVESSKQGSIVANLSRWRETKFADFCGSSALPCAVNEFKVGFVCKATIGYELDVVEILHIFILPQTIDCNLVFDVTDQKVLSIVFFS